jgi:hypothetical protein
MNTVEFGEVIIGQSGTKSFNITNTGDETLEVSSVEISGFSDEGIFELVDDLSGGFSVEPEASFEIKVMFSPENDEEYMELVDINSNAKGTETLTITLEGTGKQDVSVQDDDYSIGKVFAMSAGPNPFVSNTIISYDIYGEKPQPVRITIVDASGQTIKTLMNSVKSPGEYTIDLDGSSFASGTYFVTATVNNTTKVMPVILTK